MTTYDDAETSCPDCSRGLDAVDLCEHDDPLCPRCCALSAHMADLLAAHDSLGFRSPAVAAEWASIADNDLRAALEGWGQ